MPRKRIIVLLASLTAFAPVSFDLYLPAFPDIARFFGTSTGSVQLTLSATLLGIGLGQIGWGPLSDRYGRKRPLVVGLVAFIIASLAIVFAPSLPAMVALRFLQGVAGSAGVVLSRAMVRDMYSGQQLAKVLSALMTVFGLAPVIAPLIGSAIIQFLPWQWCFVALALFGATVLTGAWRLPETLPEDRRTDHGFGGALRQYGATLAVGQFRFAAAVAALGSIGLFGYVASAPTVIMDSYGMSSVVFAVTFAVLSLSVSMGAQINIRLLGRYPVSTLLRAAVATQVVLAGLVTVAAFLHAPYVLYMAPLLLAIMTVTAINSNGTAIALDPFRQGAGSAAALIGGLQMTMGALSSATMSALDAPAPEELAIGMFAPAVLALVIVTIRYARRPASVPALPQG